MKIRKLNQDLLLLSFSLAVPLILWVYVVFHPESSYYGYGGGDNVLHFLISRFAFNHPHLFFHHWGKPVFTILSSPFAQFGFTGICLFNVIVSVSTCMIAWLAAKKMQLKASELVVFLMAFSPVFFFTATSSLTEPLFALFATASFLMFLQRKYIPAAVVFSFIIYIRSESFVLFPLFAIALLLVRKWKALPFLLTGFIVISLAGYPFYKDFFWFFTQMPYNIGHSIYGSGSLFHFAVNYKEVFGLPLLVFVVLGSFVLLLDFFVKKTYTNRENLAVLLLLTGIPFVFFIAHSWVWYKGIGGSLGLLRVMACVIPFFALIGMHGFHKLIYIVSLFSSKVKIFFLATAMLWCAIALSTYRPGYIFRAEEPEILLKQTVDFLKSEGLNHERIYYFNPLVPLFLDKDPWSDEMVDVTSGLMILSKLEPGDIYIWDAHFGPNEGQTPLDSLLAQTDLELIMMLLPNKLYNEKGHLQYAVYTFRKLAPGIDSDNYQLASDRKQFILKLYSESGLIYSLPQTDTLTSSDSVDIEGEDNNSGLSQLCFSEEPEFLGFLEAPFNEVSGGKKEMIIHFECEVWIEEADGLRAYVVFSVEEGKKFFFYEAVPINFAYMRQKKWERFSALMNISDVNSNAKIKSYFWNLSSPGTKFCIRNVLITEMSVKNP